jgi:poly(A) polymerase
MAKKMPEIQALQLAGDAVVARQVQRVAVPKRFTLQSREIWILQERLLRRNGKRAWAMLENPRFRAGYDFLLLRAQSGEEVAELAQWWSDFQSADEDGRIQLVNGLGRENVPKAKSKRRRRPPRRQPNPSTPAT